MTNAVEIHDANEDPNCASTAPAVVGSIVSRKHGDSFTDENGRVWMKLKAAEAEVLQTERNIREWIKPQDGSPPLVPGQRLENRKNAPWYVDIKALKEHLVGAQPDPKAIATTVAPKPASTIAIAQPPTAVIAAAVDHIRDINEDWRQNAERLYAEQLEHERSQRAALEKEVSDLRVELARKETPAEVEQPHREPWSWRHVFSW